jgi:hypothetical protein
MTTLSKAEACALLHVSDSTMTRRMRKGVYKFTRTGEGQYAEVQFTYEGLGLVEPTPEPTPAVAVAQPTPAVEAKPVPMPDIKVPDAFNPQEYRDGFGHTITGNYEHRMFETRTAQKPGLFDHMDPALLGGTEIGADGQPIFDGSSDNHPLNVRAIALGHLEPMKPAKSRHPNQNRQELLNAIFSDIRRGYSR